MVRVVRTLVVDDDPDLLDLVASLVRRAGHEVVTAVDGSAAHELLAEGDFDLCLLDNDLPGMAGADVARALREAGSRTRFILVSGLTRLKHARPEAVDAVVEKPFDSAELLHVVRGLSPA